MTDVLAVGAHPGRSRMGLHDRLLRNTVEARVRLARVIRERRPRLLFTTPGGGVRPDPGAVTDLVDSAGTPDAARDRLVRATDLDSSRETGHV